MSAAPRAPLVYRFLRRSDLPSYNQTILSGLGKLERVTGLDVGVEEAVASLSRRSVSGLLAFLRLIRRPLVDIYVASDGTTVAGTGTIFWRRQTAYVAGMSTRPEYRGRGIATRILEILHRRAAELHRPWLALDVESDNETAKRVYRKTGYHEEGTDRWYRREGMPEATVPLPSVRLASKSDLLELGAAIDAARPPGVAAALPSRPAVMNHNEVLVRGRRTEVQTWVTGGPRGVRLGVRAMYIPGRRIGVYLPLTADVDSDPTQLGALFDAATEWLQALGPRFCLAIAPEPLGAVGPAFAHRGFGEVVSTTVMVRPSAGGP